MKFSFDLADIGAAEIYKVDILPAMMWLVEVWNDIKEEKIYNCWKNTALMATTGTNGTGGEVQYPVETDVHGDLNSLFFHVVPEPRRILIEDILWWEEEEDATKELTDEALVDSLLKVGVEEIVPVDSSTNEPTESTESTLIGSPQEKLVAIERVKYIVRARLGEEEGMMNVMGSLKRELRAEAGQSMRQKSIDQFFM